MKVKIFIAIILLCVFTGIHAQISEKGQPYSFTHPVPSTVEIKTMPKVDVEALLQEDADAPKDEPYRFGYGFKVLYNLFSHGGETHQYIISEAYKLLEKQKPGMLLSTINYYVGNNEKGSLPWQTDKIVTGDYRK